MRTKRELFLRACARTWGRSGSPLPFQAWMVCRNLAFELHAMGSDFYLWEDITTWEIPVRPTRKHPATWDWFDCHRSTHWGLAKRGIKPSALFNSILLRLADGDYGCLPIAADALEEGDHDDVEKLVPILNLLRKAR